MKGHHHQLKSNLTWNQDTRTIAGGHEGAHLHC